MPTNLLKLPAGPEFTADCSTIFIIVHGIGTDSVPTWKQTSLLGSLLKISSKALGNGTSYFAFWDHGLPLAKILHWESLNRSAGLLINEIYELLSQCSPPRVRPIVFVGHSLGGILVKEAIRYWYQSPKFKSDAGVCIAAGVLLSTPHTSQLERGNTFCRMVALAFLSSKDFDAGFSAQFNKSCKELEAFNVPTFSVFEDGQHKEKLSRIRRSVIVDRELARLRIPGIPEPLWPAKASHKNLCHAECTELMFEALEHFIVTTIKARSGYISRRTTKRGSSSLTSRPSIQSASQETGAWITKEPVQSPVLHSPSSSGPTSSRSTEPTVDVADTTDVLHRVKSVCDSGELFLYGVPSVSTSFFPRDEILGPLEKALRKPDSRQDQNQDRVHNQNRAFALCGGGRLGKSEIANHYVHTHKQDYDAIFWVNAMDVMTLSFDFTKISFKLGLLDESKPHDMFESQKKVREWLCRGHGDKKWLVVFDNVSKPDDLRGFWPDQEGGGDILITTRCSMSEMNDFSGQFGTEVEPFDRTVAQNFLASLTEEQLHDTDQLIQATEIAAVLGGSPLALGHLSKLMKEKMVDSKMIARHRERSDSSSSTGSGSRPDLSGEAHRQVVDLVHPLLNKLEHSASLMNVLSLLDPDGVKTWILRNAADSVTLPGYPKTESAYQKAKNELIASSLITEGEDEVMVHRLIQGATRRIMRTEEYQMVFEATVNILKVLWPPMNVVERHNIGRWMKVDVLLRHVRVLHLLHESIEDLDLSLSASLIFAKLLNDAGWCLYERGNYEDAKPYTNHARGIVEALEDAEFLTSSAELHNLLSDIYYTLGAIAQITHDYGESLEYHSRLLALRKKLKFKSGIVDPLLAYAYNEFGNDFMTKAEAEIAIGFYRRSIKIYQHLPDFQEPMIAMPSVNLGLAFWLQGDHEKARSIVETALREQEKAPAKDRQTMKTGRLLYAMGNIAYSQGNLDESFGFHNMALKQFEDTIGPRHNRTCDIKYRLADHHALRDDSEKAIELLDSALQVVIHRPLFERETARIMFKKGTIMKSSGWPLENYQQYLDGAYEIYYKYRDNQKQKDELQEADFDGLVMFWSR